MSGAAAREAIDAVWRIESPRLIAALTRMMGDLGMAEDLAQDALVVALEKWPEAGVPENPGAWLMATAKHRALDHFRRTEMLDRRHDDLVRRLGTEERDPEGELHAAIDDFIGDDLLRLIFTTCHPVLTQEAQVALTLRVLGGLTSAEIARAFLVSVSTVQQRIVRAKRTLREAHVPFEMPPPEEVGERIEAVLAVIYLVFNEGYAATEGDAWLRPELCEEALRLGRVLAELAPREPEVHGLVAVMEIQASRLRARRGSRGEPILLMDQDRSRWDHLLIRRGLAALDRAAALGRPLGPYWLQGAIAACHATARNSEDTDWERIAALYDALVQVSPSPVVELNRAVAVGMAYGPEAGLELVEKLAREPALERYPWLPSARAEFLSRLGRHGEARTELERAASLTRNAQERTLLLDRAKELRVQGA